jgi:exopolyphosphatase / guanosine-5'-triphosphate,3'-diphosphate pyrophosphatase
MVETRPLRVGGRVVGSSFVSTVRVAAIDCGTNSIRLLVADIDAEAGTLNDVERTMQIVRLGEGVDRTGAFSDAALERTFAACTRYAEVIESLGASRVKFVATSASRDATNRAVFVSGVERLMGTSPEVVTGDEEARLSFSGATRDLTGQAVAPYLVIDIGGGSTEFVLGDTAPTAACSVDMGCVRLTERHLVSDPPTTAEVAAARADIERLIDEAAAVVPLERAATVVGLAGSVTTVAALDLGLTTYDSEAIHLSRISGAAVHVVTQELLAMTRAERAALPVMHPGRVDVIGGGALVLDTILERITSTTAIDSIVVSEHDILDGIAWSMADVDG